MRPTTHTYPTISEVKGSTIPATARKIHATGKYSTNFRCAYYQRLSSNHALYSRASANRPSPESGQPPRPGSSPLHAYSLNYSMCSAVKARKRAGTGIPNYTSQQRIHNIQIDKSIKGYSLGSTMVIAVTGATKGSGGTSAICFLSLILIN